MRSAEDKVFGWKDTGQGGLPKRKLDLGTHTRDTKCAFELHEEIFVVAQRQTVAEFEFGILSSWPFVAFNSET